MEGSRIINEQQADEIPREIDEGTSKIPVIEEHLHIGTKIKETGRVHVSKKVLTENYDADITVLKEEVVIEKKSINQYIDGEAPGIRLDGDTTIISVVKEVIIKRLLLVEELHITKRRTESIIPIHEVLRKEVVTVTRVESPAIGLAD